MKYHKISQPECNKIKEEVDYYLKRIPFYLNFAPLEEFGNHSKGEGEEKPKKIWK